MRFLILSCNTGEGHNSAGKAIKEYFENMGNTCDIMDALSFWSKESSKIISKGHIFVYRNLPKLFGISYRFEENHPPKEGDVSLMYEIVTVGCDKLYKFLEKEKYDGVICVHVFSGMMMAKIRKDKKFFVPTYFVATDYTCSPGVSEIDCDLYFIPHKDLIDEFVSCGVKREKIVPSGIPVKQMFYNRISKEEAKRKLKISEDERVILLSCGSMGCGPIKELTEDLPLVLSENVRLVVVCGSNRRLYTSLYKKGIPKNLTVLGFTTRMSLYMDAADVILTKPGGLSSTEGAVKHKPMIFIDAVPGCETRNLNFFVFRDYAATRQTPEDLIALTCNCMLVPEKLEEISKNIAKDFSFNAAQIIYEKIVK